jgi:ribose transport system permease protein
MSDTKPLPGTARKPRLGVFAHALPAIIIYAVLLIMLIILGGSGSYIGTIAGCIIMVLIQSLLPIFAIPEAGRRIISGGLILLLLLLYGRARGRQ